MNRYRTLPWPWVPFLIALALLIHEITMRRLGADASLALTLWRAGVMTLGIAALTLLILPSRRAAYFLGAILCAGLIGYALYAQYVLGLEPCPLCVFQRVAVIACGVVFAVAALQHPGRKGAVVYALSTLLAAGAGAAVAMRHLWIQSLPPSEVPACGPGLSYMLDTLPFTDVLQKVLAGSGECATVDWRFLGLTLPGWTLVFFLTMIVAAIALIRRD
ncbi:MAG TPA: disulfide bond formation protein B [Casimicrobiaceae bacterium]|nr:disulfide bond formation protein B [Casimicrobiaceae bacterium]